MEFTQIVTHLGIQKLKLPVRHPDDILFKSSLQDPGVDGGCICVGEKLFVGSSLRSPNSSEDTEMLRSLVQESDSNTVRVILIRAFHGVRLPSAEVLSFASMCENLLSVDNANNASLHLAPQFLELCDVYKVIRQAFEAQTGDCQIEADLVFAFSGRYSEDAAQLDQLRAFTEERLSSASGIPTDCLRLHIWDPTQLEHMLAQIPEA